MQTYVKAKFQQPQFACVLCYTQLEHFVPSSGFILHSVPVADDS